MNPSTADILAAIEATTAPDVIVLPNNSNVILSAEQAAEHSREARPVVPTRSIPAGIAAMVVYDASADAATQRRRDGGGGRGGDHGRGDDGVP